MFVRLNIFNLACNITILCLNKCKFTIFITWKKKKQKMHFLFLLQKKKKLDNPCICTGCGLVNSKWKRITMHNKFNSKNNNMGSTHYNK